MKKDWEIEYPSQCLIGRHILRNPFWDSSSGHTSLGKEWNEMGLSVGGLGCKDGAQPEGICRLCCDWSLSLEALLGMMLCGGDGRQDVRCLTAELMMPDSGVPVS